MGRVADMLRSLLFYPVFYFGSLVIVVVANVLLALGSQRRFRAVVDSWASWHRLCARVILRIKVVCHGEIPAERVLIVLKHESFFEAIDLPGLLNNPGVFAKAELMRIPLWGTIGRKYGLVEVQREQGAKALRHMLSAARAISAEGRPLAIFPEGTRVPHGDHAGLKSGFAGIYKLLDLPVVPVAVDSGRLYHRWFKRPGTVIYLVGETIPPGLPREDVEARVTAAINALNR
jgi:1-acyl-sn-glycerol-3-phosphate acyltransferase